jgi:hypothetical protein
MDYEKLGMAAGAILICGIVLLMFLFSRRRKAK